MAQRNVLHTLPFLLSALLMPSTSLILGFRDRRRLDRLRLLVRAWGGEEKALYLPLLRLLPGLLLPALLLRDSLRFCSLGFVSCNKFLLLLFPAAGAALALVAYAIALAVRRR